MNDQKVKEWARQTVRSKVGYSLSGRSRVDVIKAAAGTETLLGHYRGYRDEVFGMELDFNDDIARLEQEAGVKMGKGKRNKLDDLLQAEMRVMLREFKEFEAILTGQLRMLEALPEHKQEVLHQVDEQMHEEKELMRAIYDAVIRDGKKMVNVNQLKKKIGQA